MKSFILKIKRICSHFLRPPSVINHDVDSNGRVEQLQKCIPDIWGNHTLLYIGAGDRFLFEKQIRLKKIKTDVLEIDARKCKILRRPEYSWLNKVIQGDVRKIDQLKMAKYDLILWSHGPEILPKSDFIPTVKILEKYALNLVVLMSPWGVYLYSKDQMRNISPFDFNQTALYEKDYQKLGYQTSTLGLIDTVGSNLLAWKYVKTTD